MTNDEFRTYYEILVKYENLIDQVPDRIKFPFYDVRCEDVKQSIRKNIKDLNLKLISTFEENLIASLR